MKAAVRASTLDELRELEREMEFQGRASKAEALREAVVALARPARGWLTTGQAAERLGTTIPTVKEWIRRGALTGRQVGTRWWVSAESVDDVLGFGRSLAELEEDGSTGDAEGIYEITKKIRRQLGAEKRAGGARQ